jgi:hypothetical protein
MAYIRVIYRNKNFNYDYVPDYMLDLHIKKDEITHFYRPSEKTWTNVRLGPIRGRGGWYEGPERRATQSFAKEEEQKLEENKINPSEWLDNLWEQIEK